MAQSKRRAGAGVIKTIGAHPKQTDKRKWEENGITVMKTPFVILIYVFILMCTYHFSR
jgi:hypothetical protein